jgi:hypothetical protein
VIEHLLVGSCLPRDVVDACAIKAFSGELLRGSLQNALARRFGISRRLGFSSAMSIKTGFRQCEIP